MRSFRLLTVALAAAVTLPLAACGGSGGDPDADPAAVVPARAPVYIEANVNPEGDDVNALARKLAGTDNPGQEIKRLIDREVREDDPDFSFEEDIEPWLGNRVGLFLSTVAPGDGSKGAVVMAVEDSEQAEQYLEEDLREPDEEGGPRPNVETRTYKDTEYLVETNDDTAVVVLDDYAVTGNEDGVKGVLDAQDGETITDTQQFGDAREAVEDKGLGMAFFRFDQLFDSLGSQGAAARQALAGFGDAAVVGLGADADTIRVETAALGVSEQSTGSGPGAVLPQLPGESWLAAGTADLGGQLDRVIDQVGQAGAASGLDVEQLIRQFEQQTGLDPRRDLTEWMGDVGLFMLGDSLTTVGGGMIAQTTDPDATRQAIPRIARLLESQAGLRSQPLDRGGAEGVTLTSPGLPVPIHMGLAGERFIVAVTNQGLEQALDAETPLSENEAFTSAQERLSDGMEPSLFVNFDPISELVDQSGAIEDEDDRRAKRALDALTTMVAGGKREGQTQRSRIIIGVE